MVTGPGRHRCCTRHGDGACDLERVLRRPAGALLQRLCEDLHRPSFLDHTHPKRRHGGLVPGKFLTEMDLEPTADSQPEASWKTVLLDAATGKPVVPNGSMGFRYADSGVGRWNLDLEGVKPALSIRDVDDDEVVE